jgi:hypothetical protein
MDRFSLHPSWLFHTSCRFASVQKANPRFFSTFPQTRKWDCPFRGFDLEIHVMRQRQALSINFHVLRLSFSTENPTYTISNVLDSDHNLIRLCISLSLMKIPHVRFPKKLDFSNAFQFQEQMRLSSDPVASPRTAQFETKHSSRAREMVQGRRKRGQTPSLGPWQSGI